MPRRNNTPHHTPYVAMDSCGTKRRFPDKKSAEQAAEIQELSDPSLLLFVYKCELCGGWHLTRGKGHPSAGAADRTRRP